MGETPRIDKGRPERTVATMIDYLWYFGPGWLGVLLYSILIAIVLVWLVWTELRRRNNL